MTNGEVLMSQYEDMEHKYIQVADRVFIEASVLHMSILQLVKARCGVQCPAESYRRLHGKSLDSFCDYAEDDTFTAAIESLKKSESNRLLFQKGGASVLGNQGLAEEAHWRADVLLPSSRRNKP